MSVRVKLSRNEMVLRNSTRNRNEQSKKEQSSVFKTVDSEHQQDSGVWVLA